MHGKFDHTKAKVLGRRLTKCYSTNSSCKLQQIVEVNIRGGPLRGYGLFNSMITSRDAVERVMHAHQTDKNIEREFQRLIFS